MVAEAILDRDRGLQGLGLGADVVFPDDLAGLGLEGDTKPRPELPCKMVKPEMTCSSEPPATISLPRATNGPAKKTLIG